MMRWTDYTLIHDENMAEYFHNNIEGSCLLILGTGFDERMCDGLEKLIEAEINFDIWNIIYNEGEKSPSKRYEEKTQKNIEKFTVLTAKKDVTKKPIDMWVSDNNGERYVAEINANLLVKNNMVRMKEYNHIIIDISSMPQSIYLCLINKIIKSLFDNTKLYVLVNENYVTDIKTKAIEPDEFAHSIHGFIGTGNYDHLIWFPVLGETNYTFLQKYYNYLTSEGKSIDEICPVLPFPSTDPKRADKIIINYRKQLFSQWEVDKKNIVYVSEDNPYQVYRKLYNVVERYSKVLKPIGNCKFVFSVITSKLMSIGTLLAALELKRNGFNIGFLNINNKGYTIDKSDDTIEVNNKMYCLCLSDDGF